MAVSQEKSVQTQETVETKGKRGRKPGSVIWTHDKIMSRSQNAGIMDKAKAEFLAKVYGVEFDDNAMRVMILAHMSPVNKFWTESDEYKNATARIAELEAEAEANKARAAVQNVTASLTAETLVSALTPDQLAAIVALAAKINAAS